MSNVVAPVNMRPTVNVHYMASGERYKRIPRFKAGFQRLRYGNPNRIASNTNKRDHQIGTWNIQGLKNKQR